MLESLLLVLALSLDAFVASIAYGTNKIKIPFKSTSVIITICSSFLAISLFLGSVLKKFIPIKVTTTISFLIILILGIYYLFESLVKSYLRKNLNKNRKVNLKVSDLHFIIDIYIDETKADFNNSKELNPKEALYLSTALSLDSLAVGLGSGLGNTNYIEVILLSIIFNILAILSGVFIGHKIAESSSLNLSWLSGIILIILAFLRFI